MGREDLWGEKYRNEDLIELVNNKIKDFKLKVGQGLEFYYLIGKEEEESLKNHLIHGTPTEELGQDEANDAFKIPTEQNQ